MIAVGVSGYYRWFDKIMIIEIKENGYIKHLHLFCPSDAILVDPVTKYHFYAYDNELSKRRYREIEYLRYNPSKRYGLDCDGTIEFIKFTNQLKYNRGVRTNIWDRFNNSDNVKGATSALAWAGFGTAMADTFKSLYDDTSKGNGE